MYNSNTPQSHELPSTAKLIKSTILAVITAAIILVTIVLPAEYGIDPTGIGQKLGLKKMGEIKVSLARELKAEQLSAAMNQETAPTAKPVIAEPVEEVTSLKEDQRVFTLKPNAAVELKAKMQKGQTLSYKWVSSGGKTNFDVHGDSEKLKIRYHNYEKGSEKVKENTITAAFDGGHGWFWRNRTGKTLTITIDIKGEYQNLYLVK